MKRGFNVRRARAYYAHIGLVERSNLPTLYKRNEPVTLFAPLVDCSKPSNKRLPLPTAQAPHAEVSTWGNGQLSKTFRRQRNIRLGETGGE